MCTLDQKLVKCKSRLYLKLTFLKRWKVAAQNWSTSTQNLSRSPRGEARTAKEVRPCLCCAQHPPLTDFHQDRRNQDDGPQEPVIVNHLRFTNRLEPALFRDATF